MRRTATGYVSPHGMRQSVAIMALVVALLFLTGGCASWQAPVAANDSALRARAVSDTEKDVTLSATVLGTADSEQLFGADINGTGVQPIWIEVRNNSSHTLWLLRSGTDPSYYSPLEVAWPLHSKFAKKSNARIDAYYNALDFKSPVPPGGHTQWHPVCQSLQGDLCAQRRFTGPTEQLSVYPVSANTG